LIENRSRDAGIESRPVEMAGSRSSIRKIVHSEKTLLTDT